MKQLLEAHPSLGYLGGALAAVPPWVLDLKEGLGIAGTLVGIAIGVVTLMIQLRAWRRGR